jgi:hypothetical protein
MFLRFKSFLFVLVLGWAWALQAQDNSVSIRNRDTAPGLYESNYDDPQRGVKLSGLDPEELKAYFAAHPEFKSEMKVVDMATGEAANPGDQARRILYVVGVPLFGQERQETLDLVNQWVGPKSKGIKQWLKDLFYLDKQNPDVHVRPISKPGGRWKIVQQFMYPMISPSDMTPVSKDVIRQGIQSVLISSGIGVTIQLFAQLGESHDIQKAMAIVIPAAVINFAQSAWTSIPRPWWQNYFRRAEAIAAPIVEPLAGRGKIPDRVARVMGSIAQQAWMTAFFTVNVYIAGRGSIEEALTYLSAAGVMTIFQKKLNSMLLNIFWRTPIENSLADYVEREGNLGRSKLADVEAAKIRKFLTIVSTNLWVYSTLTHMNVEYFGTKWNFGHLGMALMGAFGISAWIAPKIYRGFTKTGRAAIRSTNACVASLRGMGDKN